MDVVAKDVACGCRNWHVCTRVYCVAAGVEAFLASKVAGNCCPRVSLERHAYPSRGSLSISALFCTPVIEARMQQFCSHR
eukprot:971138-Pleurochrysis_carterae.AAC.1